MSSTRAAVHPSSLSSPTIEHGTGAEEEEEENTKKTRNKQTNRRGEKRFPSRHITHSHTVKKAPEPWKSNASAPRRVPLSILPDAEQMRHRLKVCLDCLNKVSLLLFDCIFFVIPMAGGKLSDD